MGPGHRQSRQSLTPDGRTNSWQPVSDRWLPVQSLDSASRPKKHDSAAAVRPTTWRRVQVSKKQG